MVAARIRPAQEDDLPELVRIYNHYVESSHCTFDTEPFTVQKRRVWMSSFSREGPFRLFAADTDSQLVGYTSSKDFRLKPAYRTSVETTAYIDPEYVGRGLGKALNTTLLGAIREEPAVHRAYGGVAIPNPASVAFHEKLGFRLVGTFREVGLKFGRYWDVRWYEKSVAGESPVASDSLNKGVPRPLQKGDRDLD
jgi:phosphinothricin acetyltransferase